MSQHQAMPYRDYFDEGRSPRGRAPRPPKGTWYHGSDAELEPGTELDPARPNNYDYSEDNGQGPRDSKVFMSDSPDFAGAYGRNLYEIEPTGGEGPFPWNGEQDGAYAAPGARVVRKVPPPWERQAAAMPSLDELWADYQKWDGGGLDAQNSIQSWGNVEEYLKDVHGTDSYDDGYWENPLTINMAKLHSMAQGKDFSDSHGPIPDSDLQTGAALGLLKIRKQQHQGSLNEYLWRCAMPRADAYDLDRRTQPPDQTPVRPGPWYHSTRADLKPGTILDPSGGPKSFAYGDERSPRRNWVFMHPQQAGTEVYGDRLYEVEPLDEGPHAYNGEGPHSTYEGWVSPRARVVREIKREIPPEALSFADAMARMGRTAAVPGKLYRKLVLDMDSPEGSFGSASPELRRILKEKGPQSPEFINGLTQHGAGTFWTRDPGFARGVNSAGGGNGFEVMMEADWDGNHSRPPEGFDQMMNMPGFDVSMIPTEGPMGEIRLKPGKKVKLKSIQFRKKGEPSYRELLQQPMEISAAVHTAMPTYYHHTREPDFEIDHDRKPDNAVLDRDLPHDGRGLWVSPDKDAWARYQYRGRRPYLVELHSDEDLGGDGGEVFVGGDQLRDLDVRSVTPKNKVAMPMRDAWDDEYKDPEKLMGSEYLPDSRRDIPGKDDPGMGWIHTSPRPHAVGDVLEPSRGQGRSEWQNYYDSTGHGSRRDWVWTSPKPVTTDSKGPRDPNAMSWPWSSDDDYVYEIEPMDEGPFPFNGHGRDGWVVPRAKIKNVLRQPLLPAAEHTPPPPRNVVLPPWEKAARQFLAEPYSDAFDPDYERSRRRFAPPPEVREGPWWHANGQEYNVGDVIEPNKGYFPSQYNSFYDAKGYEDRMNWVWMASPTEVREHWGTRGNNYVYEVEPLDEGPWPYNGDGATGHVSPRVKVKKVVMRPAGYPQQKWQSPLNMRQLKEGPQPPPTSTVGREEMERAAALRWAMIQFEAMAAEDAFDPHYVSGYDDPEAGIHADPSKPWLHSSPRPHAIGDILTPNRGEHPSDYGDMYAEYGYPNRQDWVWMAQPGEAEGWASDDDYIYDVEPLDEGPHPWNGDGYEGFVSPRVRVKGITREPINPDATPYGRSLPPTKQIDKAAMRLGMATIEDLAEGRY